MEIYLDVFLSLTFLLSGVFSEVRLKLTQNPVPVYFPGRKILMPKGKYYRYKKYTL